MFKSCYKSWHITCHITKSLSNIVTVEVGGRGRGGREPPVPSQKGVLGGVGLPPLCIKKDFVFFLKKNV